MYVCVYRLNRRPPVPRYRTCTRSAPRPRAMVQFRCNVTMIVGSAKCKRRRVYARHLTSSFWLSERARDWISEKESKEEAPLKVTCHQYGEPLRSNTENGMYL